MTVIVDTDWVQGIWVTLINEHCESQRVRYQKSNLCCVHNC